MDNESLAMQDIRWMHSAVARGGLAKPKDGVGSAFAERVAIKLDGGDSPHAVAKARDEAFREMFGGMFDG